MKREPAFDISIRAAKGGRVRSVIPTLVIVAAVWAGPVKQYGPETWFEQDPAPMPIKAESIGNPLDYAGARIGLDVRNVELPRGWEGGYRYCCRFPIIDYVSNRPLYMKQWAEGAASRLVEGRQDFRIEVVNEALRLQDGGAPLPIDTAQSDSVSGPSKLYDAYAHPGDWGFVRPKAFDRVLRRTGYAQWYQEAIRLLYFQFCHAGSVASGCMPDSSAARYLTAAPARYLMPDGKRMAELTGNTDVQLEYIARAREIDYTRVKHAADILAGAVREFQRTILASRSPAMADGHRGSGAAVFESPFGRVILAGPGDDRHSKDAALIVDLGGNDTYNNNAGASPMRGGVGLCVDIGGEDRYEAAESSYVQGFGFLGVGMLVDLAGNDVYRAKHFSQGAGILGVGVLWDKSGNDSFSAHTFCQGAGMFGLGMMLDDSGDDVYDCASNGQGSATTLGLGILSDLEGNDKYSLACDSTKDALGGLPGYGQGGALSFRAYPWEKKLVAYGGVGMLVDDKGNDDYVSKGWNCQGGSYIMSFGVLVDNEGDDHYDCGTGQGSGIHVTNAILIDKKGDDVYEGGFRAGGSGSDRSPGFLIDYEGNDTYKSATSSYGTACKPFAYSLFIDYRGDDKYICEKPKGPVLMNDWHSFGGVWPESDPNAWPYAVCLDLGGKDTYQVRNRANNSETHSFGHGIFLDMEWKGGDVVGRVKQPLVPVPATLFDRQRSPLSIQDMQSFWNPSTFWRFRVVGRSVAAGPEELPQFCERLKAEVNRLFSRDLMECLHYWFVQDKIGEKELSDVFKLLKAQDPEVRTVIADDLGFWKMARAESALLNLAEKDSNAQVRRFALRSLIRLESARALPLAWRLAGNDTSEDVRRMAVNLIGKVRPSGEVLPLLVGVLENDRASSVRCAAADAIGNIGEPVGIEPLRSAAKTYDVYVQRACGRALCALYQVDGIDLLIKSMSFPSIDAFYNYDRNVPNYVSTFAGFDLPDSERYVQAKWQAWFDTHRDSINIKFNADAYKAWTNLSDSLRDVPDTAQIARYEAFLRRFPSYERAKKELAGKLNGIAWNLATAPKGSKGSNSKLALRYALRAVDLSDDPNIWDTVIEAYLASGKKAEALRACKGALAKHPDEQVLKDRLAQLQRR